MTEIFKPQDAAQTVEIIAWAAGGKTPLRIIGNGSKRGLGCPVRAAHTLDMSGLDGVLFYEPEELVLSARAGTRLCEIEKLLGAQNQMLAFEPADLGPLLGHGAAAATLGGVFAANLSGPRRIKAGAARDHLLGFEAVNGLGEAFKSGGRVMKNVTGYDLSKLICGSYGTLAALTTLTFKVLPAPETSTTIILEGLQTDMAVEVMTRAMGGAFEISGAAHLPRKIAARSGLSGIAGAQLAITALRLEGIAPSVAYRAGKLCSDLKSYGNMREIPHDDCKKLWQEVRDAAVLDSSGERCVWKICVPPAEGANVIARISEKLEMEAFLDHSGGLIWASLTRADNQNARHIRASIAVCGGHATLIRAPAGARSSIPVFHPLPAPLSALTRRVKESFDPHGILNPGLMYGGKQA